MPPPPVSGAAGAPALPAGGPASPGGDPAGEALRRALLQGLDLYPLFRATHPQTYYLLRASLRDVRAHRADYPRLASAAPGGPPGPAAPSAAPSGWGLPTLNYAARAREALEGCREARALRAVSHWAECLNERRLGGLPALGGGAGGAGGPDAGANAGAGAGANAAAPAPALDPGEFLFEYLRAGRLGEAVAQLQARGYRLRAAMLLGSAPPCLEYSPGQGELRLSGNVNLLSWMDLAARLSEDRSYEPYERAIFGLLSGNPGPMEQYLSRTEGRRAGAPGRLAAGLTREDRIWLLSRSAYSGFLNASMREAPGAAQEARAVYEQIAGTLLTREERLVAAGDFFSLLDYINERLRDLWDAEAFEELARICLLSLTVIRELSRLPGRTAECASLLQGYQDVVYEFTLFYLERLRLRTEEFPPDLLETGRAGPPAASGARPGPRAFDFAADRIVARIATFCAHLQPGRAVEVLVRLTVLIRGHYPVLVDVAEELLRRAVFNAAGAGGSEEEGGEGADAGLGAGPGAGPSAAPGAGAGIPPGAGTASPFRSFSGQPGSPGALDSPEFVASRRDVQLCLTDYRRRCVSELVKLSAGTPAMEDLGAFVFHGNASGLPRAEGLLVSSLLARDLCLSESSAAALRVCRRAFAAFRFDPGSVTAPGEGEGGGRPGQAAEDAVGAGDPGLAGPAGAAGDPANDGPAPKNPVTVSAILESVLRREIACVGQCLRWAALSEWDATAHTTYGLLDNLRARPADASARTAAAEDAARAAAGQLAAVFRESIVGLEAAARMLARGDLHHYCWETDYAEAAAVGLLGPRGSGEPGLAGSGGLGGSGALSGSGGLGGSGGLAGFLGSAGAPGGAGEGGDAEGDPLVLVSAELNRLEKSFVASELYEPLKRKRYEYETERRERVKALRRGGGGSGGPGAPGADFAGLAGPAGMAGLASLAGPAGLADSADSADPAGPPDPGEEPLDLLFNPSLTQEQNRQRFLSRSVALQALEERLADSVVLQLCIQRAEYASLALKLDKALAGRGGTPERLLSPREAAELFKEVSLLPYRITNPRPPALPLAHAMGREALRQVLMYAYKANIAALPGLGAEFSEPPLFESAESSGLGNLGSFEDWDEDADVDEDADADAGRDADGDGWGDWGASGAGSGSRSGTGSGADSRPAPGRTRGAGEEFDSGSDGESARTRRRRAGFAPGLAPGFAAAPAADALPALAVGEPAL